jgi:hypothetical protein
MQLNNPPYIGFDNYYGCQNHASSKQTICTTRFKHIFLPKFTSIKWACTIMGVNQIAHKNKLWIKMAISLMLILQHVMVAIKDELKITFVTWLWGVLVTSLRNHLYGMTMIRCKGKVRVFDRKNCICKLH